MSETKEQGKHTPGPWKLDGIAKHDSSHVISGPTQKWIAAALDFNQFSRDAEVEANARLIAASPELLEALKGMVAAYEETDGFYIRYAREAIAKAENAAHFTKGE